MKRVQPIRRSTAAGAFTLIELLIVIGIIAALISILVPVINKVRQSAFAADSLNQIKNVGNAIDRYYNDFQAYPGVYSNADIATGTTLSVMNNMGTVASRLSQSENMILALCGGLNNVHTMVTWTDIGRGPMTYNVVQQKRMSAYIEATPSIMSINGSVLDGGTYFGVEATPGANTGVPEFIDRFPGGMPMIYIRARVGAVASADATGNLQYDTREIGVYTTGTFTAPANPIDSTTFPSWDVYFQNASLTTTAKRQDTYVLISPGKDRKYGTSDDICNFGF